MHTFIYIYVEVEYLELEEEIENIRDIGMTDMQTHTYEKRLKSK